MSVLSTAACDRSSDPSARPAATAASATSRGEARFSQRQIQRIEQLSPLGEPPDDETNAVVDDRRAARLGQFLFFDERMSANGQVSCSSCHQPDAGFSSPTRLADGLDSTPRHPPTLLNAAFQHWYNWDGSADTLWAQSAGPLESPREMGFTRTGVAHLIDRHKDLRKAYEGIFGELPDLGDVPVKARPVEGLPDDPADLDDAQLTAYREHEAWKQMSPAARRSVNRVLTNVTKAIAAYQTRLVRGEAPFDTFVEGLESDDPKKIAALSRSARRGLKLFLGDAGCIRCHSGPNFSDGSFHNLGLGPRPWLDKTDQGRWHGVEAVKADPFNAAGAASADPGGQRARWLKYLARTPEDHGQFKTPTLRNVELTAPYMHGGHFETLGDVLRFYSTLGEYPQVGHREDMLAPLGLTDDQIDDLIAFLESLTGRALPDRLTRQPASPTLSTRSAAETP